MSEAEQLLYKYYDENNFEVLDFKENKRNRLCYVFFSSNGLYKDRNDIEIVKKMHETRRYEWKFISSNKAIKRKASRIIFLRDIFKIFYIYGISRDVNTIEKIRDLLISLTNGMDVIIAGSSAGAYMALLIGNMLPNTRLVLSLGGVVDLTDWADFSDYFKENLYKAIYKNIRHYLFGNYWVINFYGTNNDYDRKNGLIIKQTCNNDFLINVGFNTDIHAPRPSGDNLIRLLTCDTNHLKRLKKHIGGHENLSQIKFSIYNLGLIKTFVNLAKNMIIRIMRKN